VPFNFQIDNANIKFQLKSIFKGRMLN